MTAHKTARDLIASEFTQHASGHWTLTGDANAVAQFLHHIATPPVSDQTKYAAVTVRSVATAEPASVTELWKRSGSLHYSAVHRAVAYAEAQGWLTEYRPPRRSSKTFYCLTPLGAQLNGGLVPGDAAPPAPVTALDPWGNELPVIVLDDATMRALGEYSHSLPTGTTLGKRWRRCLDQDNNVWCVGEYRAQTPDEDRKYPGMVGITWYLPVVDGGEPGHWQAR